jgi:hypothetical protein
MLYNSAIILTSSLFNLAILSSHHVAAEMINASFPLLLIQMLRHHLPIHRQTKVTARETTAVFSLTT